MSIVDVADPGMCCEFSPAMELVGVTLFVVNCDNILMRVSKSFSASTPSLKSGALMVEFPPVVNEFSLSVRGEGG